MIPVLFGAGIVQVNILVDTQFASYLQEGSVMSIYLADRVMELVLGGYAIAISTAILPLLARQASQKKMEELKSTLNFATRIVLFITVPATVGLIVLRREVIEVLFQHGDFDAASTELTAWALLFFAAGLSAFAMVKIIVPAFYALEDTRTPMRVALMAMFLNIALNFLFIRPLGNGGPPLATSLSAAFNSAALIVLFRKRYGSFGLRTILQSLAKFIAAAIVLGVVAMLLIRWPGFYEDAAKAQKAAALGMTITAAAAAYFALTYVMGSREAAELRSRR
jgi:putative peptidoglycan lipid II flippase